MAVTDPIELYDAHLGNMRSAFRTDNFELTAASARYLLGVEQTPAEIESEAHFYLAKAAMNKSDYDNAIVHLNDVIELSDNVMTAEARYTMAWIYFDRQQYDLSEQICHNANRANANYPYWVAKGLILLSDIYAGREDYFNAKAPLEAILENFTGETEIVEEANKKLADILYLEQQASRVKSDDAAEIKDFNPDENE